MFVSPCMVHYACSLCRFWAELAVLLILLLYCCVPPLLWLVNCVIMEKNVALLSDLTVYSLYCALALLYFAFSVFYNYVFLYFFCFRLFYSYDINSNPIALGIAIATKVMTYAVWYFYIMEHILFKLSFVYALRTSRYQIYFH